MNQRRRNLIFHHNDLDGYMSMAIVKRFCEDVLCEDVVTIECDHEKHSLEMYAGQQSAWFDPFDAVWVLDLSIGGGTASIYQTLRDRFGADFVWIDHHQTSYDYALNSVDNIIEGEIITNGSGEPEIRVGCSVGCSPKSATELALSYIIEDRYIPLRDSNRGDTSKCISIFETLAYGDEKHKQRAGKVFKLVTVWDTYQTSHPFFGEAQKFMLGTQMHCVPNDQYWGIFTKNIGDVESAVSWAVEIGEAIKTREENINHRAMEKNAFVARIELPGGVKVLDGDTDGIQSSAVYADVLCVNKIGGSAMFGEYADKFPLLLTYIDVNGDVPGVVKFSVYSDLPAKFTNNVSINAGKFAAAMSPSGGGHKGAAGFLSNFDFRNELHLTNNLGLGPEDFLKKYQPTISGDKYALRKDNT